MLLVCKRIWSIMNLSSININQLVEQKELLPPCQAACPAGVRARDYIALIAQGYYLDAIALIREQMPFPSACGRICQHPCETECNRRLLDDAVNIMHLKRFVSDYEFQTQPPLPKPLPKTRTEKIAVIGAGPCGLTAAQDLAKSGCPVTVFEALPFVGGALRIALPRYRLPRELLDWDIQNILALGIELHTNTALGKDVSLSELRQDKYKSILFATGSDRSRRMTNIETGLVAEGDLVSGTVWTVNAVGAGHKAAKIIDRYLTGKPILDSQPLSIARLEISEIEKRIKERQVNLYPPNPMPIWEGEKTSLGFLEMDLGYDEETALKEASRCLSCGAAEIIKDKCPTCLTCLRLCPYQAPWLTTISLVEIRSHLCRSCGLCVGECPANAIAFTMPGVKDINWRIERALSLMLRTEPKIFIFYCSYRLCSVTTYTQFLRTKPDNLGIVIVPCVSKISITNFLKAFELGADIVLVTACLESDCPYQHSMFWLRHRIETTRNILKQLGLGGKQLLMYNLAGDEMVEFTKVRELISKEQELQSAKQQKAK